MLDAAMQVMLEKGAAISLAEVAALAGVSKSGLIHHFGTRDQLVLEVVKDVHERFREVVLSHLDLSENIPGKMLRAYVRALCDPVPGTVAGSVTAAAAWGGLHTIAEVAAIAEQQHAWWKEQLAADGLSGERIQIVRRAAEGVAAAALAGDEDEAGIARARSLLLELATTGGFSTPI